MPITFLIFIHILVKEVQMDTIFNEKDIEKKVYDDRWVRFAFGPQGKVDTKNFNLGIIPGRIQLTSPLAASSSPGHRMSIKYDARVQIE